MIYADNLYKKKIIYFLIILILASTLGCSKSDDIDDNPFLYLLAMFHDIYGMINYPAGYIPPDVIVEEPVRGAILPVESEIVTVAGRVEDGDYPVARLIINEEEVKIGENGLFNAEIPLPNDGSRFVCINLYAIDDIGFSGRSRIVILKGESVPVEKFAGDGAGVYVWKGLFDLATESINPFLSNILSQDDLINDTIDVVSGSTIPIEITSPFKANINLSINKLNILREDVIKINSIKLKNPQVKMKTMDDMASLMGDLSIRGLEIEVSAKVVKVLGLPLSWLLPSTRINVVINDISAVADMLYYSDDPYRIVMEVVDLDIEINDMKMALLDFNIFSSNGIPIQIKGGIAQLVKTAVTQFLDLYKDYLGVAISLPENPINLGMINDILNTLTMPIAEDEEPVNLGSMLNVDFSAMNGAFRLGDFFGNENRIGLSLDLNTWIPDEEVNDINYHDYDEVISLPPAIPIMDALNPSDGVNSDLSLAISADTINRLLTSIADIDFEFSLSAADYIQTAIPNIQLPDNIVSKIYFNSPPFVDFIDANSLILAPDIIIDIYMNSVDMDGLQLRMGLDIIANMNVMVLSNDDHYLNIELSLNEFNMFYFIDRMGIHKFLEEEKVMDIIMPQVMNMLQGLLNMPFAINYSELIDLSSLLYGMPVPQFNSISISEARMKDGYLSMFIETD